MIIVDTSALIEMAVVGPRAADCAKAIDEAEDVMMSAGTLCEVLIVAIGKRITGLCETVDELLESVDAEIIPVDAAMTRRVASAYAKWGKGSDVNCLNWGDCYAYAVASEINAPLLYIGKDFPQTDIASVLTDPHPFPLQERQ